MPTLEKSHEYSHFQQMCDILLEQEKIRFAGLINSMGKLVAGGIREGLVTLEDEAERQKMYMELALRVSMRKDFDYTLGPVKFSASRREKALVMSFPINNNVLLISTEPEVNIEETAKNVIKIIGTRS